MQPMMAFTWQKKKNWGKILAAVIGTVSLYTLSFFIAVFCMFFALAENFAWTFKLSHGVEETIKEFFELEAEIMPTLAFLPATP